MTDLKFRTSLALFGAMKYVIFLDIYAAQRPQFDRSIRARTPIVTSQSISISLVAKSAQDRDSSTTNSRSFGQSDLICAGTS